MRRKESHGKQAVIESLADAVLQGMARVQVVGPHALFAVGVVAVVVFRAVGLWEIELM